MSLQHSPEETNEVAHHEGVRPILETRALTKDFPGVRALDNVDFTLLPGEVHVLFGENGAGKSTLISMLAGANVPTSGEILINGRKADLHSVHEARRLGVSAVFQEFSLIPQMTVEENLFLGAEQTRRGFLKKKQLHCRAGQILRDLEFQIRPEQRIDHLTRAEQQMVEIAKAFRSDLSILILDEPTASLTHHETEQLFHLVGKLKAQGVGVIYITHRMGEIKAIGDRVTVLRDGRLIDIVDAGTTNEDELVGLMTGRVVGQVFPDIDFSPGEEILNVSDLETVDGSVRGASVSVRRGEIVGFAGLVGSGKSEFAQACFGALEVQGGKVRFLGEDVSHATTRQMIDRGFMYLPADRRTDGLMMVRPCLENISLAALSEKPVSNGWILDKRAEARIASDLAEKLHLLPNRVDRTVEHFSGGNQQKVMLARSLTRSFDLIVFDEPTVGVDVGTRTAIYRFIADLCAAGAAIVLISSDLPEVLHLSNRVCVFHRGRIQAELSGEAINEEAVLSHFFEREAA